uniref:Uncharacterized protein n=1 Tax=Plectus sambesii TaxID=2011161 RepID=A0A914URR2_9BILA
MFYYLKRWLLLDTERYHLTKLFDCILHEASVSILDKTTKKVIMTRVAIPLAFLLLFVIAMTPEPASAGWGDCYETWSRCSQWSSPATGVLWQSCKDHCGGCGDCVLVPSKCPISDKAYQCQCCRG